MAHLTWLVGTAALVLGGTASAQTAPKAQTASPQPAQDSDNLPTFLANRVNGHIKAVDQATHVVTIDDSGTAKTFKFTDDSTVFIDGRLGSVDDLHEGQVVRAAFEERDGHKNLRWIDIATEPPATQGQPAPNQPAPAQPAPAPTKKP